MKRVQRLCALALFAAPIIVGGACSLQNQEGPNVTCADLECGRINACEQGIIAQCVDGKTVVWRVCGTDDVCAETWQVTGQYKCTFDATDCEGCRPTRTLGCMSPDLMTGSSTDASTTTSTGAGMGGGGAMSSSSSN
jgi:hypothetical protein